MVPINIRSFPRPAADQTPSKYFFGTSVEGPATELPVSAATSANSGTDYEGSGGIRLSGMSAELRSSANRCAPRQGILNLRSSASYCNGSGKHRQHLLFYSRCRRRLLPLPLGILHTLNMRHDAVFPPVVEQTVVQAGRAPTRAGWTPAVRR